MSGEDGKRSLPVTYASGPNAVTGGAAIQSVTEAQIRQYGEANGHVCGECRFFESGHAAAEMLRTRFMEHLVKEYGWKVEHAFPGITQERTQEIGLCAAAGDTGTTAMTAACDQFRENRGRLKRESTAAERGAVAADMRTARRHQAERFERWKKEQGLDKP